MQASTKTLYLIKRKPETSREELIAHWFANHMPIVIDNSLKGAAANRFHATKYFATLFQANKHGEHPWDGMAQLWWNRYLPRPKAPFGDPPADSFQERAEPYWPWATTEYVIMDGEVDTSPLTLNDPYPSTRSGFCKISFLVPGKEGVDYDAFFKHWLDVHAPNVKSVMEKVGGYRYCVSHSLEPELETYAGLAELYFPDESGWQAYQDTITPDGMEEYVGKGLLVLQSDTEMVGIP